jgi:hypothetical protein
MRNQRPPIAMRLINPPRLFPYCLASHRRIGLQRFQLSIMDRRDRLATGCDWILPLVFHRQSWDGRRPSRLQ